MTKIKSVFIVEPINQGWIIERLMRDIASEMDKLGVVTRIGQRADYNGEDVIFNSRFLTASSDSHAKINSLFITHVDDSVKEMELKSSLKKFNSFVCMSSQDADFIAALKGDAAGVVGLDLPARNESVRPIRLAYFSARYEDGRKNEDWIVEYFKSKTSISKRAFTLCFMGWGWESFCEKLSSLDLNYEIYRYSRSMPSEYDLYKEMLATMDALIYTGFDGGAMSVYDAIGAGIDVIATNISYHRGLDESVRLFDSREGFFSHLDQLLKQHEARLSVLNRRSLQVYTRKLLNHWDSLILEDLSIETSSAKSKSFVPNNEVLEFYRGHYKRLNFSRLRSAVIRIMQSYLIK